jgi:hypothetical protein
MFLLDAFAQNRAFGIGINKSKNLRTLWNTSLSAPLSNLCVYPFYEVSIKVISPQAIFRFSL